MIRSASITEKIFSAITKVVVCVTKTTKVYRTLFKDVSARHAYLEGEGDRSLAYWRKVHQAFFTAELAEVKLDFTPELEVVCEEFEVVFS